MNFDTLKAEVLRPAQGRNFSVISAYGSMTAHLGEAAPIVRGHISADIFANHSKFIYDDDMIIGSLRGALVDSESISDAQFKAYSYFAGSIGSLSFSTNFDHFAPDYPELLRVGVGGLLDKIFASRAAHAGDADSKKKLTFLDSARIAVTGLRSMILGYASAARQKAAVNGSHELILAAETCEYIADNPPRTFREALQLVWLVHTAFLYEGRYAMALGRLDQYLLPFYERDIADGTLTREYALELMKSTLIKIGERRAVSDGKDDVVNIAIAGYTRDGAGGLNDLSYVILEAVHCCNIPGPNLSARLYDGIDDRFLDECLKVIGSGLGYPALMNDEVNIPALARHGYDMGDCRDYCMVGCIENFLQGRQPPWSDGRFNSPLYIELALNNGRRLSDGVLIGLETGEPESIKSMEDFLGRLYKQVEFGAAKYAAAFNYENSRFSREQYTQPFISCLCADCIGRALDINDGGTIYPSVHGAACMGIGTFSDSLAALEDTVFTRGVVTLPTLRDALINNFEGFTELRNELLIAPKYGNNDPLADKYAVWFVDVHDEIFSHFRTRDGGAFYTIIAANTSNIGAGAELSATPDGRLSGRPLSDAASPSHGVDTNGPTAVVLSVTKPDYRKVSCGTVLNQKFSPSMFTDDAKRSKLLALIKVYFKRGGQEIQINSVSRKILLDAMENPDEYRSLVVRVSGFSAYYTTLDRKVQEDILDRTEHE